MTTERRNSSRDFPIKLDELQKQINRKFRNNSDISFTVYDHQDSKLAVFFIDYLVKAERIENILLKKLLNHTGVWTNDKLLSELPLSDGKRDTALDSVMEGLIAGAVFIYLENESAAISYPLVNKETRSLEKAETESIVLGPKIAFTESIETNLNILRWSIRSSDLVLEKTTVGKVAPREVRIIYLKNVANEEDVDTLRQRINDLQIDEVEDITLLSQFIEDNSRTVFPQFFSTELPDRTTYAINNGKIAVLLENSPTAILGPSSFFSFFESTEDIYMRWNIGTVLRALRFIAMFISIFMTPFYVALVTFHYEILPTQLLITLGESRASVPFPPIIEVLILEFMIELLRESGARLPTKVGQTIGIVGGVVIGTAAVEAGITSNVLIIVVALSALASYTAPNYVMGAAIRVIRIPFIFLAGLLGIIGIMFGGCLLIIHLLKLSSLGRPYLSPVYPFRWKDLNKVFIRLTPSLQSERFRSYRPKDKYRYSKRKASKKKDIDE